MSQPLFNVDTELTTTMTYIFASFHISDRCSQLSEIQIILLYDTANMRNGQAVRTNRARLDTRIHKLTIKSEVVW